MIRSHKVNTFIFSFQFIEMESKDIDFMSRINRTEKTITIFNHTIDCNRHCIIVNDVIL